MGWERISCDMKDGEEMLQRAATNAYSWWWAGHIRTKQSKWLEQNLQDMDEKVQYVLSLIQEDGDTFAKRAEMYYKKRPELIFFVEDSYRAYKALADRYDHLSTEMQNANNTLATCFPEQFQLPMDEDDEYGTKTPRVPPSPSKFPKLSEDLKGLVLQRSKELHSKKFSNEFDLKVAKSGLTKSEAIEEIDRLQKDILGLQTVKEYVKSSYQSGQEKYWSIESTIMDKQQRVCNLQDEFDIDKLIEDDHARRLMAEAALKSCRETLTELQQTQQKYARETKEEREKVEYAGQRIKHIRDQYLHEHTDGEEKSFYENNESIRTGDMTPSSCIDLGDLIPDKIKQQFDISSMSSITVPELADKIDELVSKMINLQSSVSSQTALIDRLTSESNDLHEHIRTLEDDKASLTEGTQDLEKKVKELQEELDEVQDLNKNMESLNSKLESRFAEAQSSLDHISGKLSNVKAEEEHTTTSPTHAEDAGNTQEQKVNRKHLSSDDKENAVLSKIEDALDDNTNDDDLKWPMMLLDGEEDKEKLLLREYTIILKNYKFVKRKLNAMEKKEKNEEVEKITELRVSIAKRDEAIQYLRSKLISLQRKLAETMNTNTDNSSTLSPSDDQEIEDIVLEEGNACCTTQEDNYLRFLLSDQKVGMSTVEEKLRLDIDTIQDENLDFWLRFSTSFHQIQKFKTMVEDLQGEISLIKRQRENKSSKSGVRTIYIHLKEIEAELKAWLNQSVKLKQEVERRSSCLCDIQEKICKALENGIEGDEIKFSSHQAAKFQGEILNMKQENNKVSEELQAGDEHITSIQVEVDRTLRKLSEEFGPSSGKKSLERTSSRSRIPLRAFIFGAKSKKQKSTVSFTHPNRKYQVPRDCLPM